jgi:hypothetical protein
MKKIFGFGLVAIDSLKGIIAFILVATVAFNLVAQVILFTTDTTLKIGAPGITKIGGTVIDVPGITVTNFLLHDATGAHLLNDATGADLLNDTPIQ